MVCFEILTGNVGIDFHEEAYSILCFEHSKRIRTEVFSSREVYKVLVGKCIADLKHH